MHFSSISVDLKLTPHPSDAGFFKAPQAPPPRRSEKRSLYPPRNLMAAIVRTYTYIFLTQLTTYFEATS